MPAFRFRRCLLRCPSLAIAQVRKHPRLPCHDDRHFRAKDGRVNPWIIHFAVPRSPMSCVPPNLSPSSRFPTIPTTTGVTRSSTYFLFLARRSLLKSKREWTGLVAGPAFPDIAAFKLVDGSARKRADPFCTRRTSQQSLMLDDTFPRYLLATHESVGSHAQLTM